MKKRWKPTFGEVFYTLDIKPFEFKIIKASWIGDRTDEAAYANRMIFRTKLQVISALRKIKAILKGGSG